jgi:hypothetical protein
MGSSKEKLIELLNTKEDGNFEQFSIIAKQLTEDDIIYLKNLAIAILEFCKLA